MPRPASSATPSSFRNWRTSAASSRTTTTYASAASVADTPPPAQEAAASKEEDAPLLVLFPRRSDLGNEVVDDEEEGFFPSSFSTACLRTDGRGGLSEFFVPGSPTFVRTAQPVLLVLSTLGGLAVLGALLTV